MIRWPLTAFVILILTLVAACDTGKTPSVHKTNELIVLTRAGATTYTPDDASGPAGFDHDLAQMFAQSLGRTARFIVAANDEEIYQRLKNGDAQFAAAWLTPNEDPELQSGPSYFESANVLVTHEASLPISEIEQLAGRTVHVLSGSRQATALHAIQPQAPELHIVEDAQNSELDLLESVATQRSEMALVDRAVFDIAGNYYPQLQSSLEIGPSRPIAWLFAPHSDPMLLAQAAAFFAAIKQDGRMARLQDRYFGHVERLDQADIATFIERIRTVLPKYRSAFQAAQASTGIDWRLLAALAYQESQWDPLATSPTGVRGMMMLTEDTADHLGVGNRLDAQQSIYAGAQYLGELRDALPASVREPDRLWLALAAYNLGMGHMNGARSFAPSLKVNPDSWYEMKTVLPLLARPAYYRRLKSGKARGGEAVIMVENIRVYADILKRYEAPQPLPKHIGGSKNPHANAGSRLAKNKH